MLQPGDQAPDFVLPDQAGTPTSLGQLLRDGRGSLVLFFYPRDFTSICTREVCMVRDVHDALIGAGVEVAGVSPQDPASHRQFRDRHGLPYRLLSDPDRRVIRAYGAAGPFGMVRRITYRIGGDGRIQDAVKADFRLGRHRGLLARAGAAGPA